MIFCIGQMSIDCNAFGYIFSMCSNVIFFSVISRIKWKIYFCVIQLTGYVVKSKMKIDHQNKNDFVIVGSAVVRKRSKKKRSHTQCGMVASSE